MSINQSLDFANDLSLFFESGELSEDAQRLMLLCSIPLVLTPDLIHIIRINFGLQSWAAEADVLNSDVLKRITQDYYRMGRETRDILRDRLNRHPDPHMAQHATPFVAELMESYWYHHHTTRKDTLWHNFIESQYWGAQAILDPERLGNHIRDLVAGGGSEEATDAARQGYALAADTRRDLRNHGMADLVTYARVRRDQIEGKAPDVPPEIEDRTHFGMIEVPPIRPDKPDQDDEESETPPRPDAQMEYTWERQPYVRQSYAIVLDGITAPLTRPGGTWKPGSRVEPLVAALHQTAGYTVYVTTNTVSGTIKRIVANIAWKIHPDDRVLIIQIDRSRTSSALPSRFRINVQEQIIEPLEWAGAKHILVTNILVPHTMFHFGGRHSVGRLTGFKRGEMFEPEDSTERREPPAPPTLPEINADGGGTTGVDRIDTDDDAPGEDYPLR
ncbi:MAG: hypothetical protein AAF787_22235 [Chloroflexota bacterium]